MDSIYHTQMAQSPFLYYTPDPKPETRQHGRFSQLPLQGQVFAPVPSVPSTPIYSRPSSSGQPMPFYAPTLKSMTPIPSPRPVYHKPTILIQEQAPRLMEVGSPESDMYYYPSTPPLSTSGSTISSPSSCDVLPTPLGGDFFGVESFGFEACEGEKPSADHMSAVFIQPTSLMSTGANDLLSVGACPSLSPSPSPYPRSGSAELELDFCDPRKLTVDAHAANPTLSVELPALPTLCAGDDEEHRLLKGEVFPKPVDVNASFDFSISSQGLPIFEELSDLDSEDEFNSLVSFPQSENVHFLGSKRQRTNSELLVEPDHFHSEDDVDDFVDSEDLAIPAPPSPTETEVVSKRSKRSKKQDDDSRTRKAAMNNTSGDEAGQTHSAHTSSTHAASNGGSTPVAAPVNRRGRKQSLTEDPSKTFVCDLCSRRFRRQEHLKRHYRSLHTQEKPFECHECGKKFSRSDNLSQHARTHGSGAVVMGVHDDSDARAELERTLDDMEINQMSNVLYDVATAAPGSEDSFSDVHDLDLNPLSDPLTRKKRKRSD